MSTYEQRIESTPVILSREGVSCILNGMLLF